MSTKYTGLLLGLKKEYQRIEEGQRLLSVRKKEIEALLQEIGIVLKEIDETPNSER